MSRYSVAAHAASDRKKWILVTIAILLLIAIVVLIITTNCFTDWNKYCLFGHDYDDKGVCTRCGAEKPDEVEKPSKDPDENKVEDKDNVNGGGVATVLPGNGIRLLATKMAPMAGVPTSVAENSWSLTATVNEHADDQYVNWSIEWVNAASAWAKGKTVTEYATVTPTQAGALTATVRVLKDFGEQIRVTCIARDTTLGTKKAECLFDYVQKITGITFNMPNVSSASTSFSYSFQTTAYTVAADMKLSVGNKMELSSDYKNDLLSNAQNLGVDVTCFIVGSPALSVSSNQIKLSKGTYWYEVDECTAEGDYDDTWFPSNSFVGLFIGIDPNEFRRPSDIEELIYAFRSTISRVSSAHATFDVTFTATYGGKTYSSGNKTIEVKFDGSSIVVPVSDVTLDQSHIYA